MPRFSPRTELSTHSVSNQPPEFVDVNLFALDTPLREGVTREGAAWAEQLLHAFGQEIGSEAVMRQGEEANLFPPELTVFDRFGRRIDEARFHPSYHALMSLCMRHGMHDIAWRAERAGAHVAHAAMLSMMNGVEPGVTCPMSMTYASVAALRHAPELAARWVRKIIGGQYDAPLRPIEQKAGVTLGMAMTEKQGGSDVRANTTRAARDGKAWRLTGHKWFCSAPMSDAFLTLAQAPAGLTCFLAPRITPDGERNAIELQRLKQKLGNRANASAEIEYRAAFAEQVGEEGRGVQTIIEMVHHTRLDTMAGGLGVMRMALFQAIHHARHRHAFQKTLVDQPLMRGVLADLALELEGMTAMMLRIARAFDAGSEAEKAFCRLSVALGKYWINKRAPAFVYECMECLGGAGYVEESLLPRLYREAPLNSIWEGSSNVICLDVLRTLHREPAALNALKGELALAKGGSARFDAAVETLMAVLPDEARDEAKARWLVERLALLLQASLLIRHAPATIGEAFVARRIGEDGGPSLGGLIYGAAATPPDATLLLDRALAQ